MNKARENRNLIVGLDIGTSKIVAIVAEVIPEGGLCGFANVPPKALANISFVLKSLLMLLSLCRNLLT